MTKLLEIDMCVQCKFLEDDLSNLNDPRHKCYNSGKTIKDPYGKIPKWCLLENLLGVNND